MQEKIELQPLPILNIGQIDLNTPLETKSMNSKRSKNIRSPHATHHGKNSSFLRNRSKSIRKETNGQNTGADRRLTTSPKLFNQSVTDKLAYSVVDSDLGGIDKQSIYSATAHPNQQKAHQSKRKSQYHESLNNSTKRKSTARSKKSKVIVPQPQKLEPFDRKLHMDNLDDDHFEA